MLVHQSHPTRQDGLPKFDAETVIADFLGDIADGHMRVGGSTLRRPISELRELARVLISDLKDNELRIIET